MDELFADLSEDEDELNLKIDEPEVPDFGKKSASSPFNSNHAKAFLFEDTMK